MKKTKDNSISNQLKQKVSKLQIGPVTIDALTNYSNTVGKLKVAVKLDS